MKIIAKGNMPDGSKIQIEDWSKEYQTLQTPYTVSVYPIATASTKALPYTHKGERVRIEFAFERLDLAIECEEALSVGLNILADYVDRLWDKRYVECL